MTAWERDFLFSLFAIILLLVHFIPQMASPCPDSRQAPVISVVIQYGSYFVKRGRAGLETRCWGWYHPAILSSPLQHTDLHQSNHFSSQELASLTTPFRAIGSSPYFSIPQGTRRPPGLQKKGTVLPTWKAEAEVHRAKASYVKTPLLIEILSVS